jgi:hypothetical protein
MNSIPQPAPLPLADWEAVQPIQEEAPTLVLDSSQDTADQGITSRPINYDDKDEVMGYAVKMVRSVFKRCKVNRQEQFNHWADMVQTALTTLYQHQERPMPYACAAARNELINYVLITIRQLQGGWRLYDGDIQGWTVTNFEGWTEKGNNPAGDKDDIFGRFLPPQYRNCLYRPVEEKAIVHEEAQETECYWQTAERRILYILAGMRRQQFHPDALVFAARALALSARGMSINAIALELDADADHVSDSLMHYRGVIEQFLALSPAEQALVQAEGRLSIYHHEEPDERVLNHGRRFVAILPNGNYSVTIHKRSDGRKDYASIQAGRRVDGRSKVIKKVIGNVGQITPEKLCAGAQAMQLKMAQAFPAAAGD